MKASAIALVRKGAGLQNYMWVDSQDTAGVDKTILRGCAVWLIGVQREANEIKRRRHGSTGAARRGGAPRHSRRLHYAARPHRAADRRRLLHQGADSGCRRHVVCAGTPGIDGDAEPTLETRRRVVTHDRSSVDRAMIYVKRPTPALVREIGRRLSSTVDTVRRRSLVAAIQRETGCSRATAYRAVQDIIAQLMSH